MQNNANIVCRGTAGTDCCIGGVIGAATSKNADAVYKVANCQFGSDTVVPVLRFAGAATKTLYIGQICGATDSDLNTSNTNYGAVMISGSYELMKGDESSQFGQYGDIAFAPDNI